MSGSCTRLDGPWPAAYIPAMKKLLCTLGMWLLVLGVSACNGAAIPPADPTKATGPGDPGGGGQVIAGGAGADVGDNFDVSPVEAPAEVVARVRWKSPRATIHTIAAYAKMPASFVDANVGALVKEIVRDELDEMVNVKAFAEVIALDAPVDMVVMVDTKGMKPKPMAGVSIGLTSLRAALGAARNRGERIAPGVWKLAGDDQSFGTRCVIAAAAGKAPARLICGERYKELAVLAPYMARTMPTLAEQPVDVRGELKLRGLAKRYGQMLKSQARGLPVLAEEFKLGNKAFDDAVMEAATALAEEAGELIFDLDAVRIDLSVHPQNGAKVKGALQFAGNRSWVVQTLTDGSQLAGPAPEMFWRAPKSSTLVTYGRSGDPAHFSKMLRIGQRLLQGYLADEKFGTAADRRALAKLLRPITGKYKAGVTASGHFPSAKKPAASGGAMADLLGDSVGWQLFGVEEGPAAIKAYLQELVRAYNRPTLQRELKKILGSDAKDLPKVRTTRGPAALGPGSLAVEIKFQNVEDPLDMGGLGAGAGKPKTTTVTAHLLLMSDGGKRTWVGVGLDRDALAKLMASTKGASPGPDSLEARSGLAVFKRGRHTSGSVFSMQLLLDTIKPAMSAAMSLGVGSSEVQQFSNMLNGLPHKGQTPITVFGDTTGGRAPRTSFEMNIGRGTLEDVGYLVRNLLTMLAPAGAP